MNDIQFTPHFKLSEFVSSETATKQGIENNPSPEAVENMRLLSIHTLEPLREALGLPIVITSGYRCKALNDLIAHHSQRSQHMKGQAADFYVKEVSGSKIQVSGNQDLKLETGASPVKLETSSLRELLVLAFRTILTDPSVDFDQLIIYPTFIHVSCVSHNDNRHKIMSANGQGTYRGLSHADALAIV